MFIIYVYCQTLHFNALKCVFDSVPCLYFIYTKHSGMNLNKLYVFSVYALCKKETKMNKKIAVCVHCIIEHPLITVIHYSILFSM